MKLVKNENDKNKEEISDKEAQEAFIKLLKWICEDPSREGSWDVRGLVVGSVQSGKTSNFIGLLIKALFLPIYKSPSALLIIKFDDPRFESLFKFPIIEFRFKIFSALKNAESGKDVFDSRSFILNLICPSRSLSSFRLTH